MKRDPSHYISVLRSRTEKEGKCSSSLAGQGAAWIWGTYFLLTLSHAVILNCKGVRYVHLTKILGSHTSSKRRSDGEKMSSLVIEEEILIFNSIS